MVSIEERLKRKLSKVIVGNDGLTDSRITLFSETPTRDVLIYECVKTSSGWLVKLRVVGEKDPRFDVPEFSTGMVVKDAFARNCFTKVGFADAHRMIHRLHSVVEGEAAVSLNEANCWWVEATAEQVEKFHRLAVDAERIIDERAFSAKQKFAEVVYKTHKAANNPFAVLQQLKEG